MRLDLRSSSLRSSSKDIACRRIAYSLLRKRAATAIHGANSRPDIVIDMKPFRRRSSFQNGGSGLTIM